MFINRKLIEVDLNKIDLSNDEFVFTFPQALDSIKKSIKNIGLLQPPYLKYNKKKDTFQMISGYRRVCACKELQINSVGAFLLDTDKLSPLKIFLLNLKENISFRELNIIEKSICLNKFVNKFKVPQIEVLTKYMPLLNIHPNVKMFKNYIKLADLEDNIKEFIVREGVSLSNALLFLNFSKSDRLFIFQFINKLKLGTNNLRQVLTTIEEIYHRDNVSVESILDSPPFKTILNNKDFSGPVKVKEIIKEFRKKQFPQLSLIEEKICKDLKKLIIPSEINVTYPPNLEGEKWTMKFKFKNNNELENMGEKVKNIAAQEKLKEVMDLAWGGKL